MVETAVVRCSTSAAPMAHKLSYWNETVSSLFESITVDSNAPAFGADLTFRRMGDFDLSQVQSAAAKVQRIHRPGDRAAPVPLLKIHLQERGLSANSQNGRTALLGEGEFMLCDASQPYAIDFGADNRMLVLRLPMARVIDRLGDPERYMGQRLGRHPRSALFTAFVRNLWSNCREEGPDWWDASLTDVLVDLLGVAWQEAGAAAPEETAIAVNPEWRQRILSHIDEHLHDPGLRTSTIAGAFGISARYVQLIFADMGTTVSAHILQRRLGRAAERLRGGTVGVLISDVAFDAGFQDLSYFSRSFRSRFGMSAKQFRDRHG